MPQEIQSKYEQPKKIFTKCNEIWLNEEGILIVKAIQGADIDEEEAIACFEIYRQLGCYENKVLQLLDARADMSITREARNYAAEHGKDFFIASAIVTDSFTVRLIVNFFNSFYKPLVPFKLFSTEEEALAWLRNFK